MVSPRKYKMTSTGKIIKNKQYTFIANLYIIELPNGKYTIETEIYTQEPRTKDPKIDRVDREYDTIEEAQYIGEFQMLKLVTGYQMKVAGKDA